MIELLYLVFFLILYIVGGTHDGYLLSHINVYRKHSSGHSEEMANYYNKRWHTFAVIREIFILSLFTIMVGIGIALKLILPIIALRSLVYDAAIYRAAGLGINYYPTANGKWDLWDRWILYLKSKGIGQYTFKILFLILTILLTCII